MEAIRSAFWNRRNVLPHQRFCRNYQANEFPKWLSDEWDRKILVHHLGTLVESRSWVSHGTTLHVVVRRSCWMPLITTLHVQSSCENGDLLLRRRRTRCLYLVCLAIWPLYLGREPCLLHGSRELCHLKVCRNFQKKAACIHPRWSLQTQSVCSGPYLSIWSSDSAG